MASLFPRSADAWLHGAILLGVVALLGIPLLLMGWVRTSYATGEGTRVEQPVPFSHQLHVTGFRIDCRYCHDLVERSATAGVPQTRTCVPCHTQPWLDSPLMGPVRRSLASGQPIAWRRVNTLPDFVFFNHAIHVHKGVGCETCHGRVDRMASVEQAAPLTMNWCLDCHRQPAQYLRPVEQMTTMGWTPARPQAQVGPELQRRYHVQRLTNCTTCHR